MRFDLGGHPAQARFGAPGDSRIRLARRGNRVGQKGNSRKPWLAALRSLLRLLSKCGGNVVRGCSRRVIPRNRWEFCVRDRGGHLRGRPVRPQANLSSHRSLTAGDNLVDVTRLDLGGRPAAPLATLQPRRPPNAQQSQGYAHARREQSGYKWNPSGPRGGSCRLVPRPSPCPRQPPVPNDHSPPRPPGESGAEAFTFLPVLLQELGEHPSIRVLVLDVTPLAVSLAVGHHLLAQVDLH